MGFGEQTMIILPLVYFPTEARKGRKLTGQKLQLLIGRILLKAREQSMRLASKHKARQTIVKQPSGWRKRELTKQQAKWPQRKAI